jgi:predicted RNase H-like HicB family nuclease
VKRKVVLIKNECGVYTIYVPSISGCISQGKTKKEALRNIQDAMALFSDELENDKELNKMDLI